MNAGDLNKQWLELLAILAGEVALLALLLWTTQRLRISAGWRRTFCQAVMTGVIVISLFELSGSARMLAGRVGRIFNSGSARETPRLPQGIAPAPALPATQPKTEPAGLTAGASASFSTAVATASHGVPSKSDLQIPSAAFQNMESNSGIDAGPVTARNSMLVRWLGLIWLAGSIVIGARVAAARWLFAVFRRRRTVVTDEQLLARVRSWARELGIRRRVRLVESRRLTCPIAFGVFRPTVGLPRDFLSKFGEAKREAMLAHEMAHLAAHDPFWCLLADAATALLWWHPAVWWMRRQLQLASELAADEASLLMADGPRMLSECLVELGTEVMKGPALGHLRAGGFRSSLGCRVQRLVQMEGRAFQPPHGGKAILVKIFGPMALAAIVIVCSAWVMPQAFTKGETMKSTQMKRSLVTLALMAAFSGVDTTQSTASAGEGRGPGYGPPSAGRSPGPVPGVSPETGLPAPGYAPGPPNAPYELPRQPRGHFGQGDPERGARLQGKLQSIVLDEVTFDGLPLSEVLRYVSEESRKHDPDKKGINFLINPNQTWNVAGPGPVDPTTGLPTAAAVETLDINSIIIKFNLPLRHVTMKDVLDAIVKVADRPIDYTLEDYAVVFSLRPDAGSVPPPQFQRIQPRPLLAARTFRVDTNTFAAGMESAFGIKMENAGAKGAPRSQQVQSALKELLTQLGITMENNKAIFYNERTGMLMVRATPEDLEVVQAAIETLGGTDKDQSQPGVGFVPGGLPGNFPSGPNAGEDPLRARYGLGPRTEAPQAENEAFRRRYGLGKSSAPPPGGAQNSGEKP